MDMLSTFLQIDLQSLYVAPPREKKVFRYDRPVAPPPPSVLFGPPRNHEFFNRERIQEEHQEFLHRESQPAKYPKSEGVTSKRLDFNKIWSHFKNRETEYLIAGLIYTNKNTDHMDSNYLDRFETKMKSIGFDLKIKIQPKSARRYSSSQVVPITIDCVSRTDIYDKWILMTNNNSDYIDICKYLKSIGKKIELWSFKEDYDPILDPYADKLHFIEDGFCLKSEESFVFGINWGGSELLSSIEMDSTVKL